MFISRLRTALIFLRNGYLFVMVIPLWLWSVAFRASIDSPSLKQWIAENIDIYLVLTLILGAFGLWYFADESAEARREGKPQKSRVISVKVVEITMFVFCLGFVIEHWNHSVGDLLVYIGAFSLPLVIFGCFQVIVHTTPKSEKAEEEGKEEE